MGIPTRPANRPMRTPAFFDDDRREIEAALECLLPPEDAPPPSIHRAMRYAVFAGGKRLRPILCLESARLFDASARGICEVACAFEFIHTYSLVHDDLPALDNDDLRRGQPTCHREFGEATAILAGDALLTLAFQTLAEAPVDAARRVLVLAEIARAAGTRNGMIGGQVADLEAERKPVNPEMLEYIHRSKTAALIRASIVAGALTGGATPDDADRLGRFGEQIGWAFQIVDDILDVEESSESLGKTAGKDQSQQKATYPALYGLERSRIMALELVAKAKQETAHYGSRAARLEELADFLILRRT
jgi:geranylgeranyl diphosphate synthase, type II